MPERIPPCSPATPLTDPQQVLEEVFGYREFRPGQRRIIDAVGDRLGAKPEQVFVNLDKYGNTSAASVAIALDEAVESGRIQRGDLVLLVVFGAGLTWAAAVIEW